MVKDQRAENGNTALIYGANNRLQGVAANSNEENVSYRYNAKGQRVSKIVVHSDGKKEIIHFHYNQSGLLMAETDGNGKAINEYLYIDHERIARVDYEFGEAGHLVYIHNDHLGTPRLMTDEYQRVVWTANTLPFGQSVASIGDEQQKLKFPGQYFDGETGYAYNYFRDYDASIGRYIQSDPIGLLGGVNTFGYVEGNPVRNIDRHGLFVLGFCLGADAGGGGLGVSKSRTWAIDSNGDMIVVDTIEGGLFSKSLTSFARGVFGLSSDHSVDSLLGVGLSISGAHGKRSISMTSPISVSGENGNYNISLFNAPIVELGLATPGTSISGTVTYGTQVHRTSIAEVINDGWENIKSWF